MRLDAFDLPVTVASDEALRAYTLGVELLLSAQSGTEERLQSAIDRDPLFALGHAALARHRQVCARMDQARAGIARAAELAATATPREQGQIRVLQLAIGGQGAAAFDALKAHLGAFPKDAVAMSTALGVYGLLGFSGRVDHHAEQRRLLEWVRPHWPEDGWLLGYLGWSEIETGEPERGGDTVARALELKPANANAAHAAAHGHVERGEAREGLAFTRGWIDRHYAPGGILYGHLHWHAALFELDQGLVAEALARYRAAIEHSSAPPMPRLADGASLLWRLKLRDAIDGAEPWQAMAELTVRNFASSGLAFADLHAAMTEAATGCTAALERRIAALDRRVAEGTLPPGAVVPALCRAMGAFARRDWEQAIAQLEAALPDLPRVGGSHAQRDVFTLTLASACFNAGRPEHALRLIGRPRARGAHMKL